MSGDEVPTDDEEHVHADETARQPVGPQVEQHDGHHGDGAQRLDIGAERVRGDALGEIGTRWLVDHLGRHTRQL
jgi:hypothetical protein